VTFFPLLCSAWDPTAHRGRTIGVVARRVALVIALGTLGAAFTGPARPAGSRLTFRGTCGPALCVPLARGWSSSVGPGVAAGRPAAWLLAGNFRFPTDAATHEGAPSVRPGKLLISVGDFPILPAFAHWPLAARLRLPRSSTAVQVVSWRVRFLGRAVMLSVRFGSTPDAALRRLANATLAAVQRR
jgi:hypothetical protein